MGKKRLDLYYFGDTGAYDRWNPAYVCAQEYADEILYQIACHPPSECSSRALAELVGAEEDVIRDRLDSLSAIGAIGQSGRGYRICFPVLLQEDVLRMRAILSGIGAEVGEAVISMKEELYPAVRRMRCANEFSAGRVLYHVLCASIFDGTAFDFFEEKKLFCTAKRQAGNRTYLIIGYEACEAVAGSSTMLLCSSNNYHCNGICYNSFGDADGLRIDAYRLSRIYGSSPDAIRGLLSPESADLLLSNGFFTTMSACSGFLRKAIIDGETVDDPRTIAFLRELGYVTCTDAGRTVRLRVPVFQVEDSAVTCDLSALVLSCIYPVVQRVFGDFSRQAGGLTAIRHGVDISELGNEVWHQIFGLANEYLVEQGFVAAPERIEGQGRYLKSIAVE